MPLSDAHLVTSLDPLPSLFLHHGTERHAISTDDNCIPYRYRWHERKVLQRCIVDGGKRGREVYVECYY